MSLYKFFVAPDPLFIDPIYGTVHKYDIFTKEPNQIYPAVAVFVSAFGAISVFACFSEQPVNKADNINIPKILNKCFFII